VRVVIVSSKASTRAALDQFDREPGVAIVAFFQRGVVAGELELMQPFQLDANMVELLPEGCGGQQAKQSDEQEV
jgi:hypothetical protein